MWCTCVLFAFLGSAIFLLRVMSLRRTAFVIRESLSLGGFAGFIAFVLCAIADFEAYNEGSLDSSEIELEKLRQEYLLRVPS